MESDDAFHAFVKILSGHLPFAGAEPLEPTDSLVDMGLDSMNTLGVLAEIEQYFGITIPDEALTTETFDTVGSLWAVVAAHGESTSSPDPGRAAGPGGS